VLADLSDSAMADEFRAHLFNPHAATPRLKPWRTLFCPPSSLITLMRTPCWP
jgi:hypothetical protein